MMRASELMKHDTFVTNVAFGAETIEITFMEKREQSEAIMMARTIVMDLNTEERLIVYSELQDRLRDLIDWGIIELRNPPPQEQRQFDSSRQQVHDSMIDGESNIYDGNYLDPDEQDNI